MKTLPLRSMTSALAGLVLAALPLAQSTPDTASLALSAFGVAQAPDSDALVAVGPGWAARFDAGRVEVKPALGREAARTWPLTFEYESIHVGASVVHAVGERARPRLDGLRVAYEHAPHVVERYDVGRDGVELSFVVRELPARDGDLVVRGRIATDLLPLASPDGGLLFARHGVAELGGVRVGGVTGVDADGRTVAGGLRVRDGGLELVLPASFVATAALPLVVDPLIGAELELGASDDDQSNPDVAYEPSADRFLVVWETAFSAVDSDVRGQLVSAAGSPIGGAFAVSATDDVVANGRAASVALTERFVVVYQRGPSFLGPWEVHAVDVHPQTGAVSGAGVVGSGAGESHLNPDVGGQASSLIAEAVVVWQQQDGGIRGRRLYVSGINPPSPFGDPIVLSSSADSTLPTITQSGGSTTRHLIGWQRFYPTPAPGDHDLWLVEVDAGIAVKGTLGIVSPGTDEQRLALDGDGYEHLLAFQRSPSLGAGPRSIVTQLVHWSWDTVSLTAEPEQVLAGDTVDQVAPCVAWAGGEALVGWERRGGPFVQSTVELAWVDTTTGLRVDPTQASLGAGFHAGEPAAASRWSGLLPSPGADDDEVLLAFARHDVTPPLDGDVVIQLAEAVGPGGSVVDVGGGCGPGGVATVDGPVALGNPAFAVELDGADAVATLALLNVAAPGAAIPCGSCSFLAPGLLFAQPVVAGGAVQALPILNDASLLGATVEAQWAVLPTASSPCALFATVAMSNRLSLTVDL